MSWADSEFEDAWFGDDRLRQRAIRVCERLAEHPSESSVLRTCRSGGGIPVLFQREGDGGPCVGAPSRCEYSAPCGPSGGVVRHDGAGFHGQTDRGPLELRRDLYLHVTTALTPQLSASSLRSFSSTIPLALVKPGSGPSAIMPGRSRRRRVAVGCGLLRACARSGAGNAVGLPV
jgi:hypothetical protein